MNYINTKYKIIFFSTVDKRFRFSLNFIARFVANIREVALPVLPDF